MKNTFRIIIFSLAIIASLFSFEVFNAKSVSAQGVLGNSAIGAAVSTFPVIGGAVNAVGSLYKGVRAATGAPKNSADNCQVSWVGQVTGLGIFELSFNCLVAQIANMALRLSSWLLWAAGLVFQQSLLYSLDMTGFINRLDIVNVGWKIFRDIANICFIFILLAIAIGTILRIDSYHVKKTLATVIIAALLLNFSLFFTKVVIDASNILALQFYKQIVVTGDSSAWDGGLSSAMMNALGVASIYSDPNGEKSDSFINAVTDQATTLSNIITIGAYGSVLIICAAFVFLVGTILFLIRTIVLVFLMILSPLAFMCLSLPSLKGHFSKWQSRLINEAFFAPAFMIMIYIVFKALSQQHTTDGNKVMNFASFLTGNKDAVGTAFTFLVLIGLMLGSLVVAKKFGATGGDFARNIAGKASFGATAWMGRQTLGRAFNKASNSEVMQRWKNSNGLGLKRGIAGFVDSRAKGTYDLRNTGVGKAASGAVGGLGTVGGVGGYQKFAEDQRKRSSEASKLGIIKGKRDALTAALANPTNVAGIQDALSKFSDSEYKELDPSVLSNPLVAQNSRHSQIKGILDEKHDKLSAGQKDQIRTHRLHDLNQALGGSGGRSVQEVLEGMDDAEKSSLPETLLSNPKVFMYLGKGVQESIAKREDLTPTQKKAIGIAKNEALIAAADAPTVAGNKEIVAGIVRGMGARGLLLLHNSRDVLTKPLVAKYLSVSQLKELADMGGVNGADLIGRTIDGDSTAAGYKYMQTQEARALWGLPPL